MDELDEIKISSKPKQCEVQVRQPHNIDPKATYAKFIVWDCATCTLPYVDFVYI